MGKTLILGNKPDIWWRNDVKDADIMSVPNISMGRTLDISNFILSLPTDLDCLVIDADSLDSTNIELPLDLILYTRLMLHECRKTSLCHLILVSDIDIEAYRGYGAKSMVLMTQNISLIHSEDVASAIQKATTMTPAEYVSGFLNLIKIEPQEKVEGRHSIANEWGAEALFNVVSGGIKSNIIPIKAASSLYFKYSNVVALDTEDIRCIVEGRVSQYLTNKITLPYDGRYLLIDDEAGKGWSKVLEHMLPNATQDVWDRQVNSYDEISIDVRNKISSGHYELIFLDLRMAGVKEDNILNPEEFSGMKILKSIKKVNKGIQVIMLTATNKAWNVKAFIDAGANGYYMKESPEYHFSLKYSEQNAYALVQTIKECMENSYLQDIVAMQKSVSLPADSELSDNIYNQLSIAISLVLKARSTPEYAYAYISLEQVFEIAASYLIRQETKGNRTILYFTEDVQEQCRLYIDGKADGYLESHIGGKPVAQWKKIASIYYQLYHGTDKQFDKKVRDLIALRNEYIHPKNGVKPNITADDFIKLHETMMDFLSLFK